MGLEIQGSMPPIFGGFSTYATLVVKRTFCRQDKNPTEPLAIYTRLPIRERLE